MRYYGIKNQFNYDVMQIKIDDAAKTFETGIFTLISKAQTVTHKRLKEIIGDLKLAGYTEIKNK